MRIVTRRGDGEAWASVAIDTDGVAHVAYMNWGMRPSYASAANDWTPVTLSRQDFVRGGVSISADDDVRVAYINSAFELHHLTISQGSPGPSDVLASPAYSVGSGDGFLAFGHGDRATSLRGLFPGMGTAVETVADLVTSLESPAKPSVVVDEQGRVHVAYGTRRAAFDQAHQHLGYAMRDDSGQGTDEVVVDHDGIEMGGDLGVDGQGRAYLVYEAFTDGQATLKFAERSDDGTWNTGPLTDSGVVGHSPGIAVESDGQIHIAFITADDELRYLARSPTGQWSNSVVLDDDINMTNADRVSIAISSNGDLHIAYSDINREEVRYLTGTR